MPLVQLARPVVVIVTALESNPVMPVASRKSQLRVATGRFTPSSPPLFITFTVNGAPLEIPLSVTGPLTLSRFQSTPFVPVGALSWTCNAAPPTKVRFVAVRVPSGVPAASVAFD